MKMFLALLVAFLPLSTFAFEEHQFKLGVQAGHVGLQQDVGSAAGNAVGVGGLVGYQVSDDFLLNLSYLQSNHTNLKHQEVGVGLDWYFNSYDVAYFFLSAGTDFISHEITNLGTATGFGLYGGLGTDVEISQNLMVGLTAKYHNAFEATLTPAGSTVPVKAIQNYVTVGLRFTVGLGGKN